MGGSARSGGSKEPALAPHRRTLALLATAAATAAAAAAAGVVLAATVRTTDPNFETSLDGSKLEYLT